MKLTVKESSSRTVESMRWKADKGFGKTVDFMASLDKVGLIALYMLADSVVDKAVLLLSSALSRTPPDGYIGSYWTGF